MRASSLLIMTLLLECVETQNENEISPKLFKIHPSYFHGERSSIGLKNSYWLNPSQITVCWETPGFDDEKKSVKKFITNSWSKHSSLRFRGWQDCDRKGADIRIVVEDEHGKGPRTKDIGRHLKNVTNGMRLNFMFINVEAMACLNQRMYCIEMYAIHEFGHAIGLTHEHLHKDAPAEQCQFRDVRKRNETKGDYMITNYDPESVMNYCAPKDKNPTKLSDKDISAVRYLYPPDEPCLPTEFDCGNGQCIKQKHVCDGDDDAKNRADEFPINPKCGCNGRPFKHATQACCNGRIDKLANGLTHVEDKNAKCCGQSSFNKKTHCCVQDELKLTSVSKSFGHGFSFNRKTHTCCEGNVVKIADGVKKELRNSACCAGQSINTLQHTCCDGQIVPLAKGVKDGYDSNSGCCGKQTMNTLTQKCKSEKDGILFALDSIVEPIVETSSRCDLPLAQCDVTTGEFSSLYYYRPNRSGSGGKCVRVITRCAEDGEGNLFRRLRDCMSECENS